jgi:hypothetical protein
VENAVSAFLDDDDDDEMTGALNELLKQSGDQLEDRLRIFLEAQGVCHWTPEAASEAPPDDHNAAEVAGGTERAFYLTENDMRTDQAARHGRQCATPDSPLVDARGVPVRVPIRLHDSGSGRPVPAQRPLPATPSGLLRVEAPPGEGFGRSGRSLSSGGWPVEHEPQGGGAVGRRRAITAPGALTSARAGARVGIQKYF